MSEEAMAGAVTSTARTDERSSRTSRPRRAGRRTGLRAFVSVSAALFAASAAGTILLSESMSDMGEMTMPGGWTLSMLWMRMPGQTWLGAGAAFLGMWTAMTTAMMLPSLATTLWRNFESGTAGTIGSIRPLRFAGLIGAGYFTLWTVLGVAVFLLGNVLASLELRVSGLARAVPIAASAIIASGGVLQFTDWKAHHLALCRDLPCTLRRQAPPANATEVLRCGLRLGLHCCLCTAGLTAILLVLGVMDLRAMAIVTIAITAERLAPASRRIAHASGAAAVAAGLILLIAAA